MSVVIPDRAEQCTDLYWVDDGGTGFFYQLAEFFSNTDRPIASNQFTDYQMFGEQMAKRHRTNSRFLPVFRLDPRNRFQQILASH